MTWILESEGCAVAPVVPVFAKGQLIATLALLWDDEQVVQVHVWPTTAV